MFQDVSFLPSRASLTPHVFIIVIEGRQGIWVRIKPSPACDKLTPVNLFLWQSNSIVNCISDACDQLHLLRIY